mmetsp:Transcript_6682/g.13736  ORF Transcript_6682/g.13736 Transcript_6682/m.13736 type:complete len:210 (-) Transcript_6682:710-1339(-)
MTTSIDNSGDSVDESHVSHPTIHELIELGKIVPSILIVTLNVLHPIEKSCNPFQLRVFFTRTYDFWSLTKVYVWISAISPFICSCFSQIVIELSVITHTSCLNDSSAPPATSFDIRPPSPIRHSNLIIESPTLLTLVDIAAFPVPWAIAPIFVIPNTRYWEFAFRSTKQSRRCSVPVCVSGCSDFHVWVYWALHVLFFRWAFVVLVALF